MNVLPIYAFYTGLVSSMGSSSVVKEVTSYHNCCLGTRFQFEPSCRSTWNDAGKTFAFINGKTKECIPPCLMIEDCWITLDACVNVNVTRVCVSTEKVPEETRITYLSQECSSPLPIGMAPGNQGKVSLLLLLLNILAGQLLLQMIC